MPRISTSPQLAAFLDLIAQSEGTSNSPVSTDNGYDIIVSGIDGEHTFHDYSCHPFSTGRQPIIVRGSMPAVPAHTNPLDPGKQIPAAPAREALLSTASGRYQITLPTWKYLSKRQIMRTFSPQNQDLGALIILDECGATRLIAAGKIEAAVTAASGAWASFPGNEYAQGGHNMEWCIAVYTNHLTMAAS